MERAIITSGKSGSVKIPDECWDVRNGVSGVVRGNGPDTPSCHQNDL